ncbi:MAG: DUF805 domain-containing protein [Prevotella sp.]|nr:DUF805 domain-containing protein [Prevotella sp.]MDE6150675.1 DUF805 domain-containing protein [Prevotella sp.]
MIDYKELYNRSMSGDKNAFDDLDDMAGSGNAEAQYFLSRVYGSEDSPFRNESLSGYWLNKSAGYGYEPARRALNGLTPDMRELYGLADNTSEPEDNEDHGKDAIPYGLWSFSGRIDRTTYAVYGFTVGVVVSLIFFCIGFFINEQSVGRMAADNIRFILRVVLSYPLLTLSAKRAHDCSYSGWVVLIPFVGLFLLFKKGVSKENKYGPVPE